MNAKQDEHRTKRRRVSRDSVFKMGHGGTLDPLATGVLIIGLGRGTKSLADFLGGTKTYETVVLFGKTTDTYDVAGRIVAEAPHHHISQALVEEKMELFRGKIKQVPPIYSALKINGMKAYDYARTGKPLPRELESRDMVVDECKLMQWYPGGQHTYRWPSAVASSEDKAAAQKLLSVEGQLLPTTTAEEDKQSATKKVQETTSTQSVTALEHTGPDKLPEAHIERLNALPPHEKASLHTHDIPELCAEPADAPAARIRLTSSSGFYVRSFAHDLGTACESYATMSELTRIRQSGYTTQDPAPEGLVSCITYDDLDKGEEVWGPKITAVLERWMENHPASDPSSKVDDRDRYRGKRFNPSAGPGRTKRFPNEAETSRLRHEFNERKYRRNSSSPDI